MLRMYLLGAVAVILFVEVSNINGQFESATFKQTPTIKGRLLTPEEGCGFAKVRNPKIVGGAFAKPGAWPWLSLIGYSKDEGGYTFKCGGSLITSRHILTAGHCIEDNVIFVRLGTIDRYESDGPLQDVKIIHTEKHPAFQTMSGTDIGVLYLEKDVDFNDLIRPICLPINEPIRSQRFVGLNPFVAGWGRTWEKSKRSTRLLMQTQLPVLENKLCEELYVNAGINTTYFTDDVICAGNLNGGEGICYGDSGGALMLPIRQNGTIPFYEIGVVSFSMDCGKKNSPGGYASTQYHADWIQKMINKEIQ